MFTNPRYATRGATTTVPLVLQIILWDLIDSMEVEEKDYLQVFQLATNGTAHYQFVGTVVLREPARILAPMNL